MNYLSHAHEVVDEPWAVAGVCLPDWLSALRTRPRSRLDAHTMQCAASIDDDRGVLASGALRHQRDDIRFHTGAIFRKLNKDIAAQMRAFGVARRTTFLAHVLIEMLVDSVLVEKQPDLVERFYASLGRVDMAAFDDHVRSLLVDDAGLRSGDIARGVERFIGARFLEGYDDDTTCLHRLRGVGARFLRRGQTLEDKLTVVIGEARTIVRENFALLIV